MTQVESVIDDIIAEFRARWRVPTGAEVIEALRVRGFAVVPITAKAPEADAKADTQKVL